MNLIYPKSLLESWTALAKKVYRKPAGKPRLEASGDDETEEVDFASGAFSEEDSYVGDNGEDSAELYDLSDNGMVDIPGMPYDDDDVDGKSAKKGKNSKSSTTDDFSVTENQKRMIANARSDIYRQVYMIGITMLDKWRDAVKDAPVNADLQEAIAFLEKSLMDDATMNPAEAIHTAQDIVWIIEQLGIFGHDAGVVPKDIPGNLITSDIIASFCYLGLSDSAIIAKLATGNILDFEEGAVHKLAARASGHAAGKEGGVPVIHPYSENALIKRIEPNYKSSVLSKGLMKSITAQGGNSKGSKRADLGEQTISHVGTSDTMDATNTSGGGSYVALVPHIIVRTIEQTFEKSLKDNTKANRDAVIKMNTLIERGANIKDLAVEYAVLGESGFKEKYDFKAPTSKLPKSLQSSAYITEVKNANAGKSENPDSAYVPKFTMSRACAELLLKDFKYVTDHENLGLFKDGETTDKEILYSAIDDITSQMPKKGSTFAVESKALAMLITGKYTWFDVDETEDGEPFFDICTRSTTTKAFSEISGGNSGGDDEHRAGVGETTGSDTVAQELNMENTDSGNEANAMVDAVFDSILSGIAGGGERKPGIDALLKNGLLSPDAPDVGADPKEKLAYAVRSIKGISSAFSRAGCLSHVDFPNGTNMQVTVDPGDPKGNTGDIVKVWAETIRELARSNNARRAADGELCARLASLSPSQFASAVNPFIEFLDSYSGGVSVNEDNIAVNLTTGTYFPLARRQLIPYFNLARIIAELALKGAITDGIPEHSVSAADVRKFVNKGLVYIMNNYRIDSESESAFAKFVSGVNDEFADGIDEIAQYATEDVPDWNNFFVWLVAKFAGAAVAGPTQSRLIYPGEPGYDEDAVHVIDFQPKTMIRWYQDYFKRYGIPEDRILAKLAVMYMNDNDGSSMGHSFTDDRVSMEELDGIMGPSLVTVVIGGLTSPEAMNAIKTVVDANEPLDTVDDRDVLAAIPGAVKLITDSGLGQFPSISGGM